MAASTTAVAITAKKIDSINKKRTLFSRLKGLTQMHSREKLVKMADIELDHIALEITHRNDNPKHLRHFVDQYFCYYYGYVTNRNKINAAHDKIAFNQYVSEEAKKLKGTGKGYIKKEHVVPLKVIENELMRLNENDGAWDELSLEAQRDKISTVIHHLLRFATITTTEDRNLTFKSSMPDGFVYSGVPVKEEELFTRYKHTKNNQPIKLTSSPKNSLLEKDDEFFFKN
ncbi:hypothetical protein [Neptuniibacter sp. QD48_11]|uniref:hypothetical protein n=1 Tax=Neptuniibacter sp. QD48_11 TaxID=3398211 RepID=UPI0039F55439